MTAEEAEDTNGGTQIIIGVGAGVWADLSDDVAFGGRIERAALLPNGTRDGKPTVELLIRISDGSLVHANTTWRLWQAMTNAFGADSSTWEVAL